MNKISSSTIANAIYLAAKGKSGKTLADVLTQSALLIKKERLLSKSEEILSKIGELSDRETGLIRAKIKSGAKLGTPQTDVIKRVLKKRYQAKEVVLDWQEDLSLLSGVKIEARDELIDLSLKHQIKQLQNYLIANQN